MTDKKITDEEIIAHLKCCAEGNNCKGCVYSKHCDGKEHLINAIDLINRQKADIEVLNIQVCKLWDTASLYKAERDMWDNYNKNLLTANTALSNEILEAKAEAYKEFAKRLKAKSSLFCSAESSELELIEAVKLLEIDNLLEEMVGEEE